MSKAKLDIDIDEALSDKLLRHARDLDDYLNALSEKGWSGCSTNMMRMWTDQFYHIIRKHYQENT